ncbi:MAG: hypothetical protein MJZ75_03160 [Paludibacteraceae bacterium]|nr:hypothetical protein [Paludibacteraceae bacterium]
MSKDYNRHIAQYIFLAILVLSIGGCATTKNTGASRAWHQLKVVHNVQFNGEQSYKAGMEALNKAHADNFATTLPLYPVSDHKAAESSASSMDQAIEKCRKSIKLHSIKARPKVNPKKRDNAKYQNWLKNKEFNNQMWRAWLMLGQSEFHKGDFLGSVGTFRYIARLYENDPNMVALCQLWIARAYAEMGWVYEAEDVLSKVKVDDLKHKNESFYSAVYADVLLKGNRHKEALPFVKTAKHGEKRKEYLPRFEYVLAQLYQENGQFAEARNGYKRVFRLHPEDVAMEFNARIHYAELNGDTTKSLKQLRQMTHLYKFRDQLDQIYGTMGNIMFAHHDTTSALAYYEKGIAASTQHGDALGEVLITAGDLYYDRTDYPHASPCYKQAAQIISAEHADYKRVQHRSEVLDEVVIEVETIQLQDSLQHLGSLSEKEQLKIIEKIIADLKEQARQDSIQQAEQARQEEIDAANGGGLQSVDLSKMIGNRMGEDANWYFYNPQLMRSGKQDFIRKWGNRPLEDNWRRQSKASVTNDAFAMVDEQTDFDPSVATDSLSADADSTAVAEPVTDIYMPEYYLQQIPKTPEDYEASNAQIADALYNLIFVYRDRVGDEEMSQKAWSEFRTRFPDDERMPELYYDQYLNALRLHHDDLADNCRQTLLSSYPQSPQAAIVQDPNYFNSLRRMAVEQDSLYQATYDAYRKNIFPVVKANKQYAETNYPLTPLMPRFLFLNAVATAKTDGQQAFTASLQDMVARYPDDQLSAMAKDMLAMMGQGMEAKKGGTVSSLTDQRTVVTEKTEEVLATSFSPEKNEPSFVYIVIANDEPLLNDLLYQIALYNFSQFLIKDFDLKKVPLFTISNSALEIAGFESIQEAEWYISLLRDNSDLNIWFNQWNARIIPITETNLKLINHPFTLDEYIEFY